MRIESVTWKEGYDVATFGAGCFWCVEAIFQQLKGVIKITPGYAGGKTKNPSYLEISHGKTGHAEVCQIIFDTEIISYDELLEVFWLIHDPTTLNRQGIDVGSQYRSVIFYHSKEQKYAAEEYKLMLNQSECYCQLVCTEIIPFVRFFKAEDYHVNYYTTHLETDYCTSIISPKLAMFCRAYKDKLKVTEALN